jgi:multidrug efflux pump subunit AcrB
VPKIRADVDREKARAQGVSLTDLYETMQVYLGSLYVNDFNRFGRTYPVTSRPTSASACSPRTSCICRPATLRAR